MAILVLIFAPLLTVFLQLTLSRTREFDEDLGATALTGDPQGLASALSKMERYRGDVLSRIFLPGHREPHPSILRTHPQTEERI
jgi:heat shock protein HtpX